MFTRGYSGELILVQRRRASEQPRELDAASLETAIIHRDELAKLFGLKSPQMLDVQAHAGIVVRAARKGWFKLGPSITGLVEHQRSVAAKHSSRDGKHDVVAESAKLKRAQRELIELRNAQERGELISAKEVLGIFQDLVHHVRGAILCFPNRARAELPHLISSEVSTLERIARELLRELAALGSSPPGVEPKIFIQILRVPDP